MTRVLCRSATTRDTGDGREHYGPISVSGPDGCSIIDDLDVMTPSGLCSWCAHKLEEAARD